MRKLKSRILTRLTKHLFNTITSEDVVWAEADHVRIGGQKASPELKQALKEEARGFLKSDLWKKVLKNRLLLVSNERMYNKSKCWEDMISGKAMLYCIDIIENILVKLATMK